MSKRIEPIHFEIEQLLHAAAQDERVRRDATRRMLRLSAAVEFLFAPAALILSMPVVLLLIAPFAGERTPAAAMPVIDQIDVAAKKSDRLDVEIARLDTIPPAPLKGALGDDFQAQAVVAVAAQAAPEPKPVRKRAAPRLSKPPVPNEADANKSAGPPSLLQFLLSRILIAKG